MTNDTQELHRWIEQALAGDRLALESIVRAIQDRVYGLALRMLGNPHDAEDAAQEILVKVVTNLSGFRAESAFTTWVHRISVNHLLTARHKHRAMPVSFEDIGHIVDDGIANAGSSPPQETAETRVLARELRLTCTTMMLQCLDDEHRLAFILGEIFELSSTEAASVLEITPVAFRKRVSRARSELVAFMKTRCGVYDTQNPCHCSHQVPYAIQAGLVDPNHLRFARHPVKNATPERSSVEDLVGLLDAGEIFRSHPHYAAPGGFLRAIKDMVTTARTQ